MRLSVVVPAGQPEEEQGNRPLRRETERVASLILAGSRSLLPFEHTFAGFAAGNVVFACQARPASCPLLVGFLGVNSCAALLWKGPNSRRFKTTTAFAPLQTRLLTVWTRQVPVHPLVAVLLKYFPID